MNPPDYYPVPYDVMELFEAACKKYITSPDSPQKGIELVVGWLMGGEWAPCDNIENVLRPFGSMFCDFTIGCINIMPLNDEIKANKQVTDCNKYFREAAKNFKKYLNEPQNP